ncbi:MAG: hypothetical protein LBT20_00030, partial [Clostridiales bacterium]|nr:hypothetical protein [Clostridiales bacterium]
MNYTVKLDSIRLANIKNVLSGRIKVRAKKRDGCDIIGIYGQNGTGKTAVIDCVEMIQELFMGRGLQEKRYYDCLYVNTSSSTLAVGFFVETGGKRYDAAYEAELKFTGDGQDFFLARESLKITEKGDRAYRTTLCCDFSDVDAIVSPQR